MHCIRTCLWSRSWIWRFKIYYSYIPKLSSGRCAQVVDILQLASQYYYYSRKRISYVSLKPRGNGPQGSTFIKLLNLNTFVWSDHALTVSADTLPRFPQFYEADWLGNAWNWQVYGVTQRYQTGSSRYIWTARPESKISPTR